MLHINKPQNGDWEEDGWEGYNDFEFVCVGLKMCTGRYGATASELLVGRRCLWGGLETQVIPVAVLARVLDACCC